MLHALLVTAALFLSISTPSPVSAGWETQAAVNRWIRYTDSFELGNTISTAMAYGAGRLTWRPRSVGVDTWLVRWDRRSPMDIFRNGFEPRVDLANVIGDVTSSALDLRTYVADSRNTPSVFVSTTRQRDDRTFWTPRQSANMYRYDIYAPGGIDVNPSLGPHNFENQNEIAFVGGIHTQYIYGAVQYGSDRRQYRYHVNPNFVGQVPRGGPQRCRVPRITYTTLPPTRHPFCSPSSHSSRKKRSANDDYMRGTGDFIHPDTPCSYCYGLRTSLAFYQPAEVGKIEVYGDITATIGSTTRYIWSNTESENIRVTQGSKYGGTCVTFQTTTSSNPRVCYVVKMYEDDNIGDDIISDFSGQVCSNTDLHSSYSRTSAGEDGRVVLNFSAKECRDCVDRNDCSCA